MTNRWTPGSRGHALELVSNFLGAPRFAAALTNTIIGTGLASLFLRDLIGWPGLIGMVTALVALASLSMFAGRHAIEWHGLLPISLLVFVAWVAVSVFWSQYQWATTGSVLYFAAFTMLGIYIGLLRDTIQIARAFGDVLRVALGFALGLEILSGVLLDSPFRFLQIEGKIDELGPIQGIWGDRNQLAVIALLAMVTFATELRTRSVRRPVSATSLALATVMLVLSRSPIGYGALAVLAVMTAALLGLRRLRNENKRYWQFGLLAVAIAVGAISWAFRVTIINGLSASGELSARLRIWRQIRLLIPSHELDGWGWVGLWRNDVEPYRTLLLLTDRDPASGFNAFLDVWLQLGIVGLIIFVGLVGLTFIRSWLLASKQRSIVYAWPALTLVVLILTALAESSLLVEFGWLTFVVCSVKAARELSWRKAFAETVPTS